MSEYAAAGLAIDVLEIAALLFGTPEAGVRAALITGAAVQILTDSACVLYRFHSDAGAPAMQPLAVAGDLTLAQDTLAGDNRLLAPLLSGCREPVIYNGAELLREDYAHLHVAQTVVSIGYLPLLAHEEVAGALEVLTFRQPLLPTDVEALSPLLRIALPAILAAEGNADQNENLLDSVRRLTQLYDLEKSLNSTLDLDHVTGLIPRKVLPMLSCEAVHLWLFDNGTLTLIATSGDDPTVRVGMTQAPGQGYVADMAEEGTPLLIADPDDERLRQRSAGSAVPVWTAMLAPLMQDDAEVGVLEAVNKSGGASFDEDDEFFLSSIAETVASALKNATLLFAERKLAILEALVKVSSEITSTLRLERLLQIIVNSPQNVLPFERCAIALDNRGKLQLKAISGMSSIPIGDAQVEQLHALVLWLSTQTNSMYLRRGESGDDSELPEEAIHHFEVTGYGGLYTLPLLDDQGRVGVLLYESSDPNFLELSHTEMIKILGSQATVAIRNALLYREVPLISLLEPLMHKKQALLRSNRGRRIGLTIGAGIVGLFLVLCPWPMRLVGAATVAPQHLDTIAAPLDGNVVSVFAHEGQYVEAGQVIGAMNDLQWRAELNTAEARYQAAVLTMQSDLAHRSARAGEDRAQVEYLRAEADRARNRMESAQLRSPIRGIVVTPALQNAAGEHLDAGGTFAQVLDLSTAVVDVAIAQRDAGLLRPGQPVVVKLDSYPQRTWRGAVTIISPQAEAGSGERSFAARVPLPNADAVLRAGMAGRAKVFTGYRSAGYVLLRRPALWVWQTLWNWFGW